MEAKKKFYWLWAAIGLLLCLNIITIGWVVRKLETFRSNRQNPEVLIARRLSLTPDQMRQYRQSRSQMRRQVKPHEDSLRVLWGELFGQIKQSAISEEAVDRLLEQMDRQNSQITRLRFRHWQQVRALCTPDQQVRFDQLIYRLEQGINNPGQAGLRERLKKRL